MAGIVCEKSFAVDACYANFYSGGDLVWSKDGKRQYCHNTTEVAVVNVETGQVVQRYGLNLNTLDTKHESSEVDANDDVIHTFALSNDDELLITVHRSGLLRLWSVQTGKVMKLWKSQHKGPVVKVQFSQCNKLLCTSGGDSTLRIWDFVNSCCLNVLKDFPGPILLLQFRNNANTTEIYAAGADNIIYCWNYMTKKLLRTLRGHLSQITGIGYENNSEKCKLLATVGRDKVLIIWNLDNGTQYKVIPMFEELEGVFFLPATGNTSTEVVVACTKGSVKLVNYDTTKITTMADTNTEIKYLLYCQQTHQVAVVTAEQNIMVYDFASNTRLKCIKQLIGFNDEILDMCYLGENERFLAVATNSKNIKIYDTAANMNCKIISGHKDTVMTLSSTSGDRNLLLSASKDCSIMLWQLNADHFNMECIAKGNNSHTSSIGCLSFGCNSTSAFASVCQDGSMKVWNLKRLKDVYFFELKYSAIAHEKEINCVTYSPNNKIIATASQDKTAKLWSGESNAMVGILHGHSRGVWCIRFSPVDQIVLTSSSDCTMRIWSLSTMACLKRLDQECTILRAEFIEHGKFIVSAASDGLIKFWNIKTNACSQTVDEHNNRIWSLAISDMSKKYFYSGGADSKIIKWGDITEEMRNVEIDKQQSLQEQEQTLSTLLHQKKNMQKAFMIALTLDKPKTTYNIVNQYVRQYDTTINNIITKLNVDQCVLLLEHVKAWSTNSRHCKVSNFILHHILRRLISGSSTQRLYNTNHLVEALLPYTQRHFNRVTEINKELAFLEFIVKCI